MVNKNEYLIPKTEEVRIIENNFDKVLQEPSLKNKVTEKDFFISCPLHEGDKKIAQGIGWSGAIGVGILTFACPPAGAAMASVCLTTAVVAKGTNYIAKNIIKNKNVEEGAEIIGTISGIAAGGDVVKNFKK
ncbi:hypothetical protein [endosymbiont GvMRE of Glomus versiforme]|uniref:hypothetical protein n=1 Tax=endosymbiont GvMRE of Glomus versiforme TaxID=2039283 RepID=UPI000EC78106|nr:hypothetical protein [endosymbiont GvMRE of Glomus versiforme]RHZ35315.1 hypothetical protein GvMRE_IIg148 [endosymbiont GvMRE of Glomus versiforme]